jgi:hypothetical protein
LVVLSSGFSRPGKTSDRQRDPSLHFIPLREQRMIIPLRE